MKTTKSISKFWMWLLTLCLIASSFCACSKDNETGDEPLLPTTPVSSSDWQTIPKSGGTIEKGDITLEFPSGTFGEETKVAVSEVKKGETYAEFEASTFYQVTLPAKVDRDIKVKIKSHVTNGDIMCVAIAPGHRKSTGEDVQQHMDLGGSYANGEYTVTLPATSNEADNGNLWIKLGLVDITEDSGTKGVTTRGLGFSDPQGKVKNFQWHFTIGSIRWLRMSWSEKQKVRDLVPKLNNYIKDALTKITDLGFVISGGRNIPFVFTYETDHPDAYGFFNQSWWEDKNSTIELNLVKLLNGVDDTEISQTVIHELLHYFQAWYDDRPCMTKKLGGEEDIMNEAASVWIEQFMDNGKLNGIFLQYYVQDFASGFLVSENGNSYANQGYGMSTLLYYLTDPMSGMEKYGITKNSIVDLFGQWRFGKHRGQTYYPFKRWLVEHKSSFYDNNDTGYDKFLLALLTGKIAKIPIYDKAVEAFDKNFGQANLNKDGTYNFPERVCLTHGCRVDKILVFNRESFKGKEIVVKQSKPYTRTYLVASDGDGGYAVANGYASVKDSLVVKGEDMDKMISGKQKNALFLVTMNTSGSKKEFVVTCTIRDAEEDDNGARYLWGTWKYVNGSNQTILVTFGKKGSYEQTVNGETVRKGTYTVDSYYELWKSENLSNATASTNIGGGKITEKHVYYPTGQDVTRTQSFNVYGNMKQLRGYEYVNWDKVE